MTPHKVIIDTDPGVDDALAIFLALASPEMDVLGLTTVYGNAAVDVTTRNALTLVDIAGRGELPVAAGAASPIVAPYLGPVPHVHGADGQGDCGIRAGSRTALPISAANFLGQAVVDNPGEITILALGPLTNLALALRLFPSLPSQVARVVVMGGNALVPGNATPAAEANVFNDPEAADLVFGAGWPVTMVGLDVTHRCNLKGRDIERIVASSKPTSRHIAAALPLYRAFFERTNRIDGIYLHDPSAVGWLIDKSMFRSQAWPLRVETQGIGRGKTWPSIGDTDDPAPAAWQGRPLVDVCVDVDAVRLVDMVVARLS
jgi:purine nucleosidase